jgi:hypothetical protein
VSSVCDSLESPRNNGPVGASVMLLCLLLFIVVVMSSVQFSSLNFPMVSATPQSLVFSLEPPSFRTLIYLKFHFWCDANRKRKFAICRKGKEERGTAKGKREMETGNSGQTERLDEHAAHCSETDSNTCAVGSGSAINTARATYSSASALASASTQQQQWPPLLTPVPLRAPLSVLVPTRRRSV